MSNEGKKYEFTGETRELIYSSDGTLNLGGTVLLHRIRALRDIENIFVFEYDEGGWIESEDNLSQEGDCWVGNDACVFGNAVVRDNANVDCWAIVKGNAVICDNGSVSDNAKVGGDAVVSENASVTGDARVYANVTLAGSVDVTGTADISEDVMQNRSRTRAVISGDFTIQGYMTYEHFGNEWVSVLADDDDAWADETDDENYDDMRYEDDE